MAKVHVMFHYECALPQTNTFVNNQTTVLLQAQANEVWELMHHNRIIVALQHSHEFCQTLSCALQTVLPDAG